MKSRFLSNVKTDRFMFEATIAFCIAITAAFLIIKYDVFELVYKLTRAHESWQLDGLIIVSGTFALAFFYLLLRFPREKENVNDVIADVTDEKIINESSKGVRARYVLALAVMAFCFVLSYFIMDNAIQAKYNDATIINMAGRQRMLSQRIALLARDFNDSDKGAFAREEISKSLYIMRASHRTLSGNGEEQDMQLLHSQEIHDLYFEKNLEFVHKKKYVSFDYLINHFMDDVEALLRLPDDQALKKKHLTSHVANDYHNVLLPYFDIIVSRYEYESLEKDIFLRWILIAILFVGLFVVLLEEIFIFRPMVRSIEAKTHELLAASHELELRRKREKFSALGQMASGMAHEINNALQPILGMSEILNRRFEGKDEELYEYSDMIHRSAEHAKQLLGSVLDFSRDKKGVDFLAYDAEEILRETIKFTGALLSSRIELVFSETACLEDIHTYILCSQMNLIQVFSNLFKNAADAMGGQGIIHMSFSKIIIEENEMQNLGLTQTEYVKVQVRDEGPGIPEEDLENIFTPFFTQKAEGEGTGLGLAVVYGIMRQHGGGIFVHNHVEGGAAFDLYFPVARGVDKFYV